MSCSPKNHTFHAKDQTTPQTRYSTKSRFLPAYTSPAPPQFALTSGAGGSTRPKGTRMTYELYVDLKNKYQAMIDELRRYNEFRAS